MAREIKISVYDAFGRSPQTCPSAGIYRLNFRSSVRHLVEDMFALAGPTAPAAAWRDRHRHLICGPRCYFFLYLFLSIFRLRVISLFTFLMFVYILRTDLASGSVAKEKLYCRELWGGGIFGKFLFLFFKRMRLG